VRKKEKGEKVESTATEEETDGVEKKRTRRLASVVVVWLRPQRIGNWKAEAGSSERGI
jgi:hypothetical protein